MVARRQDARAYLTAPPGGISNVDEMIADIAGLQAEKERLANEACEPAWGLPTLTADEAFVQIEAAVGHMTNQAIEWKARESL
jgi:hypothetical protein